MVGPQPVGMQLIFLLASAIETVKIVAPRGLLGLEGEVNSRGGGTRVVPQPDSNTPVAL